jgi:hypothetical protein
LSWRHELTAGTTAQELLEDNLVRGARLQSNLNREAVPETLADFPPAAKRKGR